MIVFVHGVPETATYWDRLRAEIDEPSIAVELPGFGNPRPDGFAATKDAYVEWLVGEIAAIDEPVDLVGHDWGAGLTYRIATAHGDLVRSWAADVATIVHPDQVWHDVAQIWQTPGEGEAFIESQLAMGADEQAPFFEGMGAPHDDAVAMIEGMDATMGSCILDLYRSATPNTHATWGAEMGPTQAPGLIIHATDDSFSNAGKSREVAEMLGGRYDELDGLAHFWALQDPAAAADLLRRFWSEVR